MKTTCCCAQDRAKATDRLHDDQVQCSMFISMQTIFRILEQDYLHSRFPVAPAVLSPLQVFAYQIQFWIASEFFRCIHVNGVCFINMEPFWMSSVNFHLLTCVNYCEGDRDDQPQSETPTAILHKLQNYCKSPLFLVKSCRPRHSQTRTLWQDHIFERYCPFNHANKIACMIDLRFNPKLDRRGPTTPLHTSYQSLFLHNHNLRHENFTLESA